jgi:hypothetical protein
MQTAPNDIPVERLNQDFGATEPSNVSLYQPKGEYRTSLQPHVQIPPNIWGPVRNHFIMASSVSANPVDRQRSFAQSGGTARASLASLRLA